MTRHPYSVGSAAREALSRTAQQAPRLTAEETRALFLARAEAQRRGDATKSTKATQQLAKGYLYLVAQSVRRYRGPVDTDDLLSAGHRGLVQAINGYDVTRGCPFAPYATRWVKQAISRAQDRSRGGAVLFTYRAAAAARKLYRAEAELSAKLHREPTMEELAAFYGMSEEEVLAVQGDSLPCYSLHHPISDDSDSTYEDSLVDTAAGEVSDSLNARQTVGTVLHNVRCFLCDKQQHVVLRRLGLSEDGEEASFESIAKEMALSSTRVKQLYAEACATLRTLPALQRMHADLCA